MIVEMSIGYYLIFAVCFIASIYLLFMDSQSTLHRLVFLLCFSIALWGLAMGGSTLSKKAEQAIIWRKIGVIGVGAFFGFFKHYCILFCEKKSNLKRKISVLWMYLPSVMYVFIFALSEKLSKNYYQMEQGPFGWSNISKNTVINYIFVIYFAIYFSVGVGRILYYQKRNSIEKKSVNLILWIHGVMFFFFVVCEYLVQFKINVRDYQIFGVLVIMIVTLYNIKNKNISIKKRFRNETSENIYLEQYRKRLMIYLCQALILGAIIYIVIQFLNQGQQAMEKRLLFPIVLVCLSLLNLMVVKLAKNKELRTIFHSLILVAIIPVVTFQFIYSAAITVWAFPLILFIVALLYHDTTVLILLSVTTILTQCIMWILMPYRMVLINETDYFGRIAIIVFGISAAAYINHVYISRLKQLSNKVKEQDLLFQVSVQVMEMKEDNKQEKFKNITKIILNYASADKAHLIIFGKNDSKESIQFCFSQDKNENTVFQDGMNQVECEYLSVQTNIAQSNWFLRKFQDEGYVYIDQLENLPLSARMEEQLLESQGVKSLFAVPISRNNQQIGMLRLDYYDYHVFQGIEQFQTLMTIGNLAGEAYKIVH